MIRKLTKSDTQLILDFVYQREEENLFITGDFERRKDTFANNTFYGYFENKELLGLAVHFGEWNNFNISSQDEKIVRTLTDHIVEQKHKFENIACFRRYGDIIVNQLEKKHSIKAKKIEDKTVFKLFKTDFINHSKGEEETAKDSDRKELVIFSRGIFGGDINDPITDTELARINIEEQFVIRRDGKIVSTANLNGLSRNYFQVGGVGTLPEYRKQGLAKQVVSALCKTFLSKEPLKNSIMITRNSQFERTDTKGVQFTNQIFCDSKIQYRQRPTKAYQEKIRRKGLSLLEPNCGFCSHEGVFQRFPKDKTGLLFTNNNNSAAQKVYTDLGFKPFDEYIIAEY